MTQPVLDLPWWERELRVAANSADQTIRPFMTAPFVSAVQTAVGSESPFDLRARLRSARLRVDKQLDDDRRYDELRARIAAAFVLWRIDDDRQLTDKDFEAMEGLKSAPSVERRTFRQGLAHQRYQAAIGREDYGLMRLQKPNVAAGGQFVTRAGWCDALVALIYSIIDQSSIQNYWDPTTNTLRYRQADNEATGALGAGAALHEPIHANEALHSASDKQERGGSVSPNEADTDVEEQQANSVIGETETERSTEARTRPPGAKQQGVDTWRSLLWARRNRSQGSPAPSDGVRDASSERKPPSRITIWITVGTVLVIVALLTSAVATSGFGLLPSQDDAAVGVDAPSADEPQHVITPAGWGPTDRDVVSVQSRNSIVTINSMVDNPTVGDERNFMQVGSSDDKSGEHVDQLSLQPGSVYTAYVHFKNDASTAAESSVATETRLKVDMPYVVHGSANVYSRISSNSSTPSEVWDGVTVVLPGPNEEAALRYVSNSAIIHTAGRANGQPLSDDLFGEGTFLGCDALDGNLPSRDACEGYVSFDFRVDQPDFTVSASARVKGTSSPFAGQVTGSIGNVLEVRVVYQNTGSNQQDDVILRIPDLPSGLRYVKESSEIANSRTDGQYQPASDGVTTVGYNLGSYAPNGNVFFKFDLMIDESIATPSSSRWIELPSFARLTTAAGYKEAPLTITLLDDNEPVTSASTVLDPGYWKSNWGPDREVFSYKSGGAPYPVFNSLSDNPNIGDERNFVGLRLDDGNTSGSHVWSDDIWAKPGETYYMRAYVDNSGADSNGIFEAGKLQNSRLDVGISRSKGGTEASVFARLSATQKPSPVWDGATLHFDKGVDIQFDFDYGAVIENNAHPGGIRLDSEVFSSDGALIGYEQMDGLVPPGFKYASYVTLKLIVRAGQQVSTTASTDSWGPDRQMFTRASLGATYPTFNSISDNPGYGDERNFLTVKPAGVFGPGGWGDDVWAKPGDQYGIRIYGENSGRDAAGAVSAGSLQNARLKLSVTSSPGTHIIRAELSASNALTVWDSVTIHTAPDSTIDIMQDQLLLTNNANPSGVHLEGDVVSGDGAAIGYESQDGLIRPGYQYDFYVTGLVVVR